MLVGGLKALINLSVFAFVPIWVTEIQEHLKTLEICNKAVHMEPYSLEFVPVHLKTQEMCKETMRIRLAAFFLIPDCFKNEKMCIKAVKVDP